MGVRYVAMATALKLLSACPQTRWFYGRLAHDIGREHLESILRVSLYDSRLHMNRARELLELVDRHNLIRNGNEVLELGTGWIHWESIVVRLFYDVRVTLFDICDSRQLAPLRRLLTEVPLERIGEEWPSKSCYELERGPGELRRAISSVESFDELYRLLGFQYVVDQSGRLQVFEDGSFDVVFSVNVLEHVNRDILSEYIQDIYRVMRPGGYSFHKIDLTDHLYVYDRSVSPKNYLTYSDRMWKRYFENGLQYFNRVQRPEWLRLFQEAGLQLMREESGRVDIGRISVDKRYENLDVKDLECGDLRLIYRKPL